MEDLDHLHHVLSIVVAQNTTWWPSDIRAWGYDPESDRYWVQSHGGATVWVSAVDVEEMRGAA